MTDSFNSPCNQVHRLIIGASEEEFKFNLAYWHIETVLKTLNSILKPKISLSDYETGL